MTIIKYFACFFEKYGVKILLTLSIVVLISLYFYPLHPDEKVFIDIAQEILSGKVIYRDLFDNKPPGIHYVLAGVFYLFNNSIWVLRSVVVIVIMINSVLMYQLINEVTKRASRLHVNNKKLQVKTYLSREGVIGALLFITLLPVVHGTYALTELFSLPFIIYSLYIIVRHHEREEWLLFSGFVLGISYIFRQTAFFVLLPYCYALLIYSKNLSYKIKLKRVLLFGIFSMIPSLLVALYMYKITALDNLLQDVIWFNIVAYPSIIDHHTIYFLFQMLFSMPIFWYLSIVSLMSVYRKLSNKSILLLLIMPIIISLIYRPYHHYWVLILPFIVLFSVIGSRGVKWGYRWLFLNSSVIVFIYSLFIPNLVH